MHLSFSSAKVSVTSSTNGWMASDKHMEQFDRVWSPNWDDVHHLLVIDQVPIHRTKVIAYDAKRIKADAAETDIVFVPAGCARILQPADMHWNKTLKTKLRRS